MLDHLAAADKHHVIGQTSGLALIVTDQNDLGARLALFADQGLDQQNRGGIQAGGGLVQ